MRLLLDTHTLLWFLLNDRKLSKLAKVAIEDPANDRWLSPISLLEAVNPTKKPVTTNRNWLQGGGAGN